MARRIWSGYMRDYKGMIVLALLAMVVSAAASAGIVKMVEPALDQALIQRSEDMIWITGAGFAILMSLRGLANFAQAVLMQKVGLFSVERMQNQMFGKLQDVELQYIQDEGTALQLSRFSADVTYLRDAISKVYTGAGRDITTAAFMIALMFSQNWKLALFVMLCLPIGIVPIIRIGQRLRKVASRTQAQIGAMTASLDDSLKGARHVRAYNMQDFEKERAGGIFRTTTKLMLKAVRTRSASYPIMDSTAGLTLFIILVLGGYQILEGEQSVGTFMSFFTAVFMTYQPLRSLANLNSSLQQGLAAADRIFTVIDYEPRIQDRPGAVDLKPEDGRIDLDGVSFAYGRDDKDGPDADAVEAEGAYRPPVLDDVTIHVPGGKTVALVGPSGAGKTTVLNLIPRFYDVTGGRVLVDGQDIRDVTLSSLTAQMALVSQETALFNDTIRANIAYGRLGASDADIEEAAKGAAAHDFICALPDGYDTVVGEQGLRLSGGQRQRVAIARAMLKNAPILLLDEATSALDTESERQVQQALKRLMKGRTTLVIAHRLSTIVDADEIFVMQDGHVVERGTHVDLVAKGGLYAKLSRMQFNAFDETDAAAGRAATERG